MSSSSSSLLRVDSHVVVGCVGLFRCHGLSFHRDTLLKTSESSFQTACMLNIYLLKNIDNFPRRFPQPKMRAPFARRLFLVFVWALCKNRITVSAQNSRPALIQKFGEDSSFWENREVKCEGICGENFLDVEPSLKRDQKPQCKAGDPVRVRTAYQYKTCYIAHTCVRKTFHFRGCTPRGGKSKEELDRDLCYYCAPTFQKYHESIKPCAAVDLSLSETFQAELNDFTDVCPCYLQGPNGTPACDAVSFQLSLLVVTLSVLFYFAL